jgi:hypothetical protein
MQIRLLLIILGFCSLVVYADEIPTLDFSKSHDYSLIAKGGVSVDKPTLGGSQGIIDKVFKVKIGNGKEFTITSSNKNGKIFLAGALLFCPSGETNIQFVYLSTGYLTSEETEQKMKELSQFFSWPTNDFSEWVAKSHKFNGSK